MTLETFGGAWSPLVWLLGFFVAFLIAYILWGLGEKKWKTGEQSKPFISGLSEPEKEKIHVKGGNVYWGFTDSLKEYYKYGKKIHSGILNDYILWFIGMAALFFIIILLPEVIT